MIKKLFLGLKLEFFYIRRMINRGFPPQYWVNYVKNRYFGSFLLKHMPRLEFEQTDDFELHVLINKSGLWMLTWALRSFLYHSGLTPKIVIHSDGTIDPATARMFESKFANLRVILKDDADRIINDRTDIPEKIKQYRMTKPFPIMELTDIFLLSNSEKVMLLDGDILFFDTPQEIVDFVQNRSPYDVLSTHFAKGSPLFLDEEYVRQYKLIEKGAANVISGIIIYNRQKLPLHKFLEYFDHTLDTYSYFIEQAGWGSMICQTNFVWLSEERYPVKGFPREKTVAKHFTTPRRHELYAYGIDQVRRKIKS